MIVDAIKKNVKREVLSSEEASQAMKEIMSGSATPSQISAFLISLSMKGESIEEIVALAKTMKEFANNWLTNIQRYYLNLGVNEQ